MKNIGFLVVKNLYPSEYGKITLVFNDLDTLPYVKNFLDYDTKPKTIKHFYGVKQTLGGIFSIKASDYETINGFPNYWSWGYEDNMIYNRALKRNLTIDRSVFFPLMDGNIIHLQNLITFIIFPQTRHKSDRKKFVFDYFWYMLTQFFWVF